MPPKRPGREIEFLLTSDSPFDRALAIVLSPILE
jgi:hypothetical protein